MSKITTPDPLPTPYTIVTTEHLGAVFLVASDPGHTIVCQMFGTPERQLANAEAIVRAVNAHEELVAALKHILSEYDAPNTLTDDVMQVARRALAKAKREPL